MKRDLSIITIALLIMVGACTADEVTPAAGCDSFETKSTSDDPNIATVKDIIDQTCAYSGCHDGAGGIAPGDYNKYSRIVQDIENGSFAARVITQRDNPSLGMPPDKSVYPQSLQDSLSQIQLDIITCWLQDGFPE